jgi:putative 4-mercaptohistidine N1-methyltranferase
MRYETEASLSEYLLFHYGEDQDLMPYHFGPLNSFGFPVRCVTECLDIGALPLNATALELGCAVGRSSFELARYCTSVLAIDRSSAFISAATRIQQTGALEYAALEEGFQKSARIARLPQGIVPNRVKFKCCDLMDCSQDPTSYHVVLAANVLCRLPDPQEFLTLLPQLVAPKGQLILTTPYSWLEEFTSREQWLGGEENGEEKKNLEYIRKILGKWFDLHHFFDMPFLIREHLRKYQWGVAQASIWKRNDL